MRQCVFLQDLIFACNLVTLFYFGSRLKTRSPNRKRNSKSLLSSTTKQLFSLQMPSLLRAFARIVPLAHPIRPIPVRRSFSMSSTNYSDSKADPEPNSSDSTTPKKPLALPEAPHNSATQLDMSNGDASVKLDHLGPMVVNVDGTLSRISNWDKMADIEKENTLRIIGKRNQARLESLRAKVGEK